jgi:hypothetical protein
MRHEQTFTRVYEEEDRLLEDVRRLKTYGYKPEDIYIVAREDSKQDWLNKMGMTNNPDWQEVGLLDSLKNAFRSESDVVRNELEHLGVSNEDINELGTAFNKGKVVLIVRDTTGDIHQNFK